MQNDYSNFSSAVNKSASRFLFVFVLLATLGAASPSPSATPPSEATASPTPDVTQVSEFKIQEAQKNIAKDHYQIGDRIALLVEIKASGLENGEKLVLKLPEGSSPLEDQGWYIDQNTQFLGGVLRFIVSPIQTGKLTLPTLLIQKEDQSILGRTTAFVIEVSAPPKNDSKENELLDLSLSSLPVKYWVLFSALMLLLMGATAYFVFYLYQKRDKKAAVQVPQAPSEGEHIVALRKINALYAEYPYSRQNLKPLSFGLSEILKTFFSKRFKVDAIESTTDEMIELLRKEALTGANLREIQTLFEQLDLVKFTKNENYSHVDEAAYQDFKVRSQLIIQKWALVTAPARGNP